MPVFSYSGRDHRRQLVTGQLDASDKMAVAGYLNQRGIIPIDITATVSHSGLQFQAALARLRHPIKQRDLIFFFRQMHTLLRTGVPIISALHIINDSTSNPSLNSVIHNVINGLDSGLSLTAAMRNRSDVFPLMITGIIEIGESSGNLPRAFLQLVTYLEKVQGASTKARSALRYPIIVVTFLFFALIVINVFVVPAFAHIFRQFNSELPLITRIMIGFSDLMVHYSYLLIAAAVIAVVAARKYLATEQGAYRWDRYKLQIPLIGLILYNSAMSRFATTLSTTTAAGVPVNLGLNITGKTIDNRFLAEKIFAIESEIKNGTSISRAATLTQAFPALAIQMISVGEQSGALETVLNELAAYYDREVDQQLDTLSTSIEPILITVLGAIILVVALGVFLPMWGLGAAAMH
ncbi:MAG: type II secretion system F family protein [Gammaproteobacteria bacterium]|nr:type II secretion system F family protein [Gammaproteobacteria bacterium]